jgi:hypothetical protein
VSVLRPKEKAGAGDATSVLLSRMKKRRPVGSSGVGSEQMIGPARADMRD